MRTVTKILRNYGGCSREITRAIHGVIRRRVTEEDVLGVQTRHRRVLIYSRVVLKNVNSPAARKVNYTKLHRSVCNLRREAISSLSTVKILLRSEHRKGFLETPIPVFRVSFRISTRRRENRNARRSYTVNRRTLVTFQRRFLTRFRFSLRTIHFHRLREKRHATRFNSRRALRNEATLSRLRDTEKRRRVQW